MFQESAIAEQDELELQQMAEEKGNQGLYGAIFGIQMDYSRKSGKF